MPTYDYSCPDCGLVMEVTHSIKEDPDIFCPAEKHSGDSNVKMERLISLNKTGFIFKQWTEAQHYKYNRDKSDDNKKLGMKQIERYGTGGTSLKPNVAGMEVDSWSDAKKLAKESGLNTTSYDSMIAKEKNTSKSSGIDDRKWKAAKSE